MTERSPTICDATIELMRRIGPHGRMIVSDMINDNVRSDLCECLVRLFPEANAEELSFKYIHAMYGKDLCEVMRRHIAAQSEDSPALTSWKRGFAPFEQALAEIAAGDQARARYGDA